MTVIATTSPIDILTNPLPWQTDPLVAATGLDNGGWVFAFADFSPVSGLNIFAQRIDASGTEVGFPPDRVNTTRPGDQFDPGVAGLAPGGYVVIWTSDGQDGSGKGVYAQRFDTADAPVGLETQINTTTAGDQGDPAVAALAKSGYVATWTSEGQDGSGLGVYAQRYDSVGAPVGTEIRVNATTVGDQYASAVAGLAKGGHVVTWTADGQDGSGLGVYAQRYDSAGATLGVETRVNTTTEGDQADPSVAGLAGGGYVITWTSRDADGSGVYAQRYRLDGGAVGSELRVNTATEGAQFDPAVVGLADGGYAVTWVSAGPADGLYLQVFNASGARVGSQVWASYPSFPFHGPVHHGAAAVLSNGHLAALWTERSPFPDLAGRVFGPFFKGNTLSDALEITSGGPGDDTFLAAPGAINATTLTQGRGGDQVYGEGGLDRIRLTAPGVADFGRAAGSNFSPDYTVYLSSVEQILGSSGGDTFIVGDAALTDVLSVDGLGGEDTLTTREGTLNLVGKTLTKIEHVTTSNPDGTNFAVDTVPQALLINGAGAYDTVTASSLTFGESQLRKLFNNGVEAVVDASGFHHAPTTSSLAAAEFDLRRTDDVTSIEASDVAGLAVAATTSLNAPAIRGTLGPDTIQAPNVSSEIRGLAGDDRLFGGAGDDMISGGAGDDFIQGPVGGGSDTLVGDSGDDRVFAGDGDDQLLGGAGNDLLNGYYGHDLLKGGEGDDDLFGDTYPNVLVGNDTLVGGGGDDTLRGSLGDDLFSGGPGADVYRFEGPGGGIPIPGFDHDIIRDFKPGEDLLIFELFGPLNLNDLAISISRGDMVIDASARFGLAPGTHTVTLLNVTTLFAADVLIF
jgi:Ca2+-binding RTX toxin-like protein